MNNIKDNFSAQAEAYAKYRPGYPKELYEFLSGLTDKQNRAWDCATGNGQVAIELAKYFEEVIATDISEAQLKNAPAANNIIYKLCRSEDSIFPDEYFDMITVAQAIHWFDFGLFYKQVNRTMKDGGILAVMGYGLIRAGEQINPVIDHFYHDIVGPYWDKERKYIDENLATIPFPFEEIAAPKLLNHFNWGLDDLLGYFRTWSAVQHYIKSNQKDPVELIRKTLGQHWPEGATVAITFPVLLRIARTKK